MKIVVAPNAFKGSLPAPAVASSISTGIKRVFRHATIIELPIADGGDGTLDLIIQVAGGTYVEAEVVNPFGNPITSRFGILDDGKTAIVEMAQASGLSLVPNDQLNPMKATTYGTGQLIKASLDHGCDTIIVGVGGSATVDGGAGMAQALGAKLLDENGQEIGFGGEGLSKLAWIDISGLDPRVHDTQVKVACDVENPLVGPEGAALIFGPQKGATPEMAKRLDQILENYGKIIERDLGKSVLHRPSTGAAGGLSAGLLAFLDASLEPGAEVLLELMNAGQHLHDADFVITGEGQIDGQTAYGKGPLAVAKLAKKARVPVIAIAGCLADDSHVVFEHGIDALISSVDCPMSLDQAIGNAHTLVESAAERAARLIKIGLDHQVNRPR